VAIAVCEYDLALREDKLIEPVDANGDRTAIEKWERCDRMASMIIKQMISAVICGAVSITGSGVSLTMDKLAGPVDKGLSRPVTQPIRP